MLYICSCGALYGDRRDVFDQCCKFKGHTLFEVEDGLYRLVYEIQESHATLKTALRKRNNHIAILKDRVHTLMSELGKITIT